MYIYDRSEVLRRACRKWCNIPASFVPAVDADFYFSQFSGFDPPGICFYDSPTVE